MKKINFRALEELMLTHLDHRQRIRINNVFSMPFIKSEKIASVPLKILDDRASRIFLKEEFDYSDHEFSVLPSVGIFKKEFYSNFLFSNVHYERFQPNKMRFSSKRRIDLNKRNINSLKNKVVFKTSKSSKAMAKEEFDELVERISEIRNEFTAVSLDNVYEQISTQDETQVNKWENSCEVVSGLTAEEAQIHRKALIKVCRYILSLKDTNPELSVIEEKLKKIVIEKIYEGHQYMINKNNSNKMALEKEGNQGQ